METAQSVSGVPIRLTEERWQHIVANKPYMAPYRDAVLDAVEDPTWILQGYSGADVAAMPLGPRRYLHVVYRETDETDGFIVTAFIARNVNREAIIWP